MAKTKSKHVSFQAQREQCRLNKYTYIEKCGSCKAPVLMCNYPFLDPSHKKGVCRASTCTDMRKTLAEDIDEIRSEAPTTEPCPVEGSGDGIVLAGENYVPGEGDTTAASRPSMKPEDIAKSA